MKQLDRLIIAAQALSPGELVTLTYEDGATKKMTAFEAVLAITDGQEGGPLVTGTDQPPGSLVWALLGGEGLAEDWLTEQD